MGRFKGRTGVIKRRIQQFWVVSIKKLRAFLRVVSGSGTKVVFLITELFPQ
jgi:hypothetical protein